MKFYSTRKSVPPVSFKEAVIQGLPQDNGLFFPESIPSLRSELLHEIKQNSLTDIATQVAYPFVKESLSMNELEQIIKRTLDFDLPLKQLSRSLSVLELFHGPTFAFKDVGARFLAGCLSAFASKSHEAIHILVATSGDTGSAVANAFLGLEGVEVYVLFPKDKVSQLQEKQMTTLGQNITAIEIPGSFDDCQRMVKTAFLDDELNEHLKLTSANSINIARLLPQTFYYFEAFRQLENWEDVTMIVPSGNLGNICAGMLAHSMGLPIARFVAAHNANDTFPNYIHSGKYTPKPSVKTISNAMDVGDPSNFVRIKELKEAFDDKFTAEIKAYTFSDEQTQKAIGEGKSNFDYVFDPHGAVGYCAYQQEKSNNAILLETAHPAKFKDVVEDVLNETIIIPESLREALTKDSLSMTMENDYKVFKDFLMAKRG